MAFPSNQKNAEIVPNPIENTVVDDSESSEDDSPPARSTQRIIYATNAISATKKAELVASEDEEEDDDESGEEDEDSSESDATNATTSATKKDELVASESEDDDESGEEDEDSSESDATNATTSATKKAELVASESEDDDESGEEDEDSSESDATNAAIATKKAELVASKEEDEDSSGSDDSESENEDKNEKASANSVKPDPIDESKVESDSRMDVKKGQEATLTPTLKEPTTPLVRPNNFAISDKRIGETNGVVAVPQIAGMKGLSPLAEANNKRKAENNNNVVNVVGKRPMQNLSRDNNNDVGHKKRATEARYKWLDSTTSPLVNPFLSPNQVDGHGSDNRQSQTFTDISFPEETIKYMFAEGVRLLDPATFADLERKRKDHQIKQIQNYVQCSAERHNLVCLHAQHIIDCLNED